MRTRIGRDLGATEICVATLEGNVWTQRGIYDISDASYAYDLGYEQGGIIFYSQDWNDLPLEQKEEPVSMEEYRTLMDEMIRYRNLFDKVCKGLKPHEIINLLKED